MKRWSEIKQSTLYKLFLEEDEAQQQGYLEKFQYLANECLNVIANGVKPRIKVYEIECRDLSKYDDEVYGYDFSYDNELGFITYRGDGDVMVERVPDEHEIYIVPYGDKYILEHNKLVRVASESDISNLPTDFLSFADMINYYGNDPDAEIVYAGDRGVILPKKGKYRIFYNATWNEITQDDMTNDYILDIDQSVLNCLPTYMAAQLLAQDDIVRSATLKNEFELMLARLDTNIMYDTNHFRSTGGWY